jgi:hypothetical protein
VFLGLVARYWHPVYGFTSFLQLDSSNDAVKIAAFREQPVFVYRDTGGYDGLYYAQIAYHPLLDSPELAPAMDSLAYRARRILPPALAWLLAGGNPAWIVHVYSLLNVGAWLALAGLLWRGWGVSSTRGWLAWTGVLFSAGALSSVRLALTDLIALVILTAGLLAAEKGSRGRSVAGIALSGLARETSLLAVVGLLERPWCSWRNFARVAVAALPLALWMVYVSWRVRETSSGLYNFTWPVMGYIGKWTELVAALRHESERLAVWSTVLATIGLTVQAVFFLVHRQPDNRWWRVGVVYVALMLCLGTPVWEGFPGAATRVLLPLSLAFNALAHRSGVSFRWLVAGNLTVIAGLLALGSLPHDPREIAAARANGISCVARVADGWYNVERSSRHTWAWSRPASSLELSTWDHRDQSVALKCSLRSPVPRTVVVRDAQGEVWRGPVGIQKSELTLHTRLVSGRGRLDFFTLEPATAEPPERGGRTLAFALYDARLLLPEP